MMKPRLLISACLCGKNTKYNGKNNLLKEIELLKEHFDLCLICPEVMGGLPIPRDPSEINDNHIISNRGKDVTKEFIKGAQAALEIALKNDIQVALLKETSPSCGVREIYDGTFAGTKVAGQGMTTRLLLQNNIKIYSEKELDLLINQYKE